MSGIHPEARIEVLAALAYYDELDTQQGTSLAAELQKRIDTAVVQIAETPLAYPPYVFGTRRCLLRRFPYAIVFDTDPEVLVLALSHTKRRPGYWKDRK